MEKEEISRIGVDPESKNRKESKSVDEKVLKKVKIWNIIKKVQLKKIFGRSTKDERERTEKVHSRS